MNAHCLAKSALLTMHMVPAWFLQKEAVITLIVDTVQKNSDLYTEWSNLFNPITSLIGMSDDLSFDDLVPLWKEQKVSDYSEWLPTAKIFRPLWLSVPTLSARLQSAASRFSSSMQNLMKKLVCR